MVKDAVDIINYQINRAVYSIVLINNTINKSTDVKSTDVETIKKSLWMLQGELDAIRNGTERLHALVEDKKYDKS